MMVTEEQAKAKWCPLVRETSVAANKNSTASLGNRYNDFERPDTRYANPAGCRCIASECMAWRWAGDLSIDADGVVHHGHVKGGTPVDAGWCGAFGRVAP